MVLKNTTALVVDYFLPHQGNVYWYSLGIISALLPKMAGVHKRHQPNTLVLVRRRFEKKGSAGTNCA